MYCGYMCKDGIIFIIYVHNLLVMSSGEQKVVCFSGRVNFVDLQQSLNVDLSILETVVAEMVKRNNNYTLILGQLIDRYFLLH